MIKLRTKASAVIAATTLVLGSAIAVPIVDATPAYAYTCYPGYVYHGTNYASANYLDDYGGGSGTYVHTYPRSGSSNQTWCLEEASQGGFYFHPENNTGLCLDAHTYNPGQPIWVYSCNGTLPQRWCWNLKGYIVPAGDFDLQLKDNGRYNIVSIEHGGANTWTWDSYYQPPDTC